LLNGTARCTQTFHSISASGLTTTLSLIFGRFFLQTGPRPKKNPPGIGHIHVRMSIPFDVCSFCFTLQNSHSRYNSQDSGQEQIQPSSSDLYFDYYHI